MSYAPYVLDDFQGLQLEDRLGGRGAAVCTNVDFTVPGEIRNRTGTVYHAADTGGTSLPAPRRMLDTGDIYSGSVALIDSAHLNILDGLTVYTPSVSAASFVGPDSIVFGTPSTGSRIYVTDDGGLKRWDTGTQTLVAVGATTTPRGGYLAIQSRDARLVCAYSAINTAPKPSRVHFSDAGDPEVWPYGAGTPETGNFVDLNPGDGEVIMGIASLGDDVVVFKQTRAYVFYGNSSDADGNPVFDYRTVSLGDRIPGSSGFLAPRFASDGTAIYYTTARGVYRLAGDVPELISDPVRGLFSGDDPTYGATFGPLANNRCVFTDSDRLYVGDAGGSAPTLVLDKATGKWSMWNFGMAGALANVSGGSTTAFFDGLRVRVFDRSATTDANGSDIISTYQTQDLDLGAPTQKRVRQVQVEGSWTTMRTRYSTDGGDFGSYVTLAAPTDLRPEYDRRARRGYTTALELEATGAFTVSRCIFDIADLKPEGAR